MGRRRNERLALRYTSILTRAGGAADKSFTYFDERLLKEGPDLFKLFTSGRRYCQGALFTFQMVRRQDLLSFIFNSAQMDRMDIEVAMNVGAMPTTVLFIGTPASNTAVSQESPDLSALTKKFEPTKEKLAGWPVNDLAVMCEHSSVFYEIISTPVMDAVLGEESFAKLKRYFKYLHVTSEYENIGGSDGTGKVKERRAVVRLSFTLAHADMRATTEVLDKMVTLLGLVIDGLGACKLTPEQAKKAEESRRKVDGHRVDVVEDRERRLEERRAAKEAEEKARLAKLTPDQREKERAKRERIERNRRMKSIAKRM